MENPNEVFLFSAQRNARSDESDVSSLNLGIGGSAKHARAESNILGRNDILRREDVRSFKSKLMGGMLGRMCKVDPITKNQARGRFARICLEIDITKPLLGSLSIDDRTIIVEYESLGLICFKCGRYGNSKESYREGVAEPIHEEVMCNTQLNTDNEDSPYGTWLLVSYGKQGNRYFKGRVGKTGSGANAMAMDGAGGNANKVIDNGTRNGSDGSNRRVDEGFTEIISGKQNSVKTGRVAETLRDLGTVQVTELAGSRFEVLNEEFKVPMNKRSPQSNGNPSGNKL
ncbi:hypothetical protein Dsin_014990 [Dipteronia sinensis]|uniref:DUF4283 domain-containing protein n=1 Tax=Dipteronia sinensis TaxID=43782 RepID=A0AAE0EC40_9ROSI|nr:hypothetical protein Dsin_014990 [Dipteronia sinensis]